MIALLRTPCAITKTLTATLTVVDIGPGLKQDNLNTSATMDEEASQVATLPSADGDLLVMDTTSGLSSSSSTTTTSLLDLPTEILDRIFNLLLAKEDVHFQVFCEGSKNNKIRYTEQDKPTWTPWWVADLRLVSTRFKELATPIIGDHTTLRIIRDGPTTAYWSRNKELAVCNNTAKVYLKRRTEVPLKLIQLCPEFLSSRTRTVSIEDWRTKGHMLEAEAVDVTGVSKLTKIIFAPYDIADTLNSTRTSLRDLWITTKDGPRVACDHVAMLIHDMASANKSSRAQMILRELKRLTGVRDPYRMLWDVIKNCFIPGFKSDEGYSQLVKEIIEKSWKISRATIVGITDNTVVEVEFIDGQTSKRVSATLHHNFRLTDIRQVAIAELRANESSPFVDINSQARRIHMKSSALKYLEDFF